MANADQLIKIFNEAHAQPAGAGRERFLAEQCRGDLELKEQVVSLLQSHGAAGDFLKDAVFFPTVLTTEQPGDMIGRYRLLEKIGEGGCGVVYGHFQKPPYSYYRMGKC